MMAFGTFEVHAGSFALGTAHQVLRGHFLMKVPGRFSREKIPLSDISKLEVASEESLNRLGGALGWGAAGGILLGPVGELAGLIRGGRGQRVTFVCQLRDGRKFLATASSAVFAQMRTSFAITEFRHPKETPTADIFDRQKWAALVRYDQDIASAESEIRPFGQKYVDELASACMALNDKEYLPKIIAEILRRAQVERDDGGLGKASIRVAPSDGGESVETKTRCRVCDKMIERASANCFYCGTNAPHSGAHGVGTKATRSVLSVVAWMYAIFVGLAGIGLVSAGGIAGYCLIASALVALPLTSNLVHTHLRVSVPGWVRASGAIALLLIAAPAIPKVEDVPQASEAPVPSAVVATADQGSSADITGAFNECLMKEAMRGDYTSSDGGKSAMRMLIACKPQWDAYADACEKSGQTDGACTQTSVILAQAGLKLTGK